MTNRSDDESREHVKIEPVEVLPPSQDGRRDDVEAVLRQMLNVSTTLADLAKQQKVPNHPLAELVSDRCISYCLAALAILDESNNA